MQITKGPLRMDTGKLMTGGNGILLQGAAWLLFWLGPAYPLFQADPRWGHNFTLPTIFLTVGLAYHFKKISCQLMAVISAFLLVPTLLAFWPWSTATILAIVFMGTMIILYLVERSRETELLNPNPRLKSWLKLHLLTFAYIGLAHMPLIFFLVRWFGPEPFISYLPVEHHLSTSLFNAMLLILVPLAVLERFVNKLGRFHVEKLAFTWSILMMILPLMAINILGE